MPIFADRLSRLGSENAFRLLPHIKAAEQRGLQVIRCNLGEPDFAIPEHVRDEVKRQLDAGNTHYTDPQGIHELRVAVAKKMEQKGIPAAPARVVVFPGAKPPIGLCQHAYTEPGDEVIYPSPGFPIYESFTGYVGARPVPLHLREEAGFAFGGAELAQLITARTKLLYLNFPSNPTGGVATSAQLEEIADVIRRRLPAGARVYSDEVYEDIVFDGQKHLSIAALPGMAERCIVVGGVSKSFAWTGGRVGWALFPTVEEALAFRNLNINYFSCVPPALQEGARVALESPLSIPFQQKMVATFQERRDALVARLNRIDGVRCRKPGGAFYAFPNVAGVCEKLGALAAHAALPQEERERTSPSTLLQMFLLYRHGLATLDRRSFGKIGAERQQFLRISYATALPQLMAGADALAKAADDRAGFEEFIATGGPFF